MQQCALMVFVCKWIVGNIQEIIATTVLYAHSRMCLKPQQAQPCCIVHLDTSPVLLYDSGSCLQGLQRV